MAPPSWLGRDRNHSPLIRFNLFDYCVSLNRPILEPILARVDAPENSGQVNSHSGTAQAASVLRVKLVVMPSPQSIRAVSWVRAQTLRP